MKRRINQPETFVSDYYGISANILTLTSENGACEYQVTITDLDAEMTLECSKTFPTFLQAVEFARACVR